MLLTLALAAAAFSSEKTTLKSVQARIRDLQGLQPLSEAERRELIQLKRTAWNLQTSNAHKAQKTLDDLSQNRRLSASQKAEKEKAAQTVADYKKQKEAKKTKQAVKLQTSQVTVELLKPIEAEGKLTAQQKEQLKKAEKTTTRGLEKRIEEKDKKLEQARKDKIEDAIARYKESLSMLKNVSKAVAKTSANLTRTVKAKQANGTVTKAEEKFLIKEEEKTHQRRKREMEKLQKAGNTSTTKFAALEKKTQEYEKADAKKMEELVQAQRALEAKMKSLEKALTKEGELKATRRQLRDVLKEERVRTKAKLEPIMAKEKSGKALTKEEQATKLLAQKVKEALDAVKREEEAQREKKLAEAKAKVEGFKRAQKQGVATQEQAKEAAKAMAVIEKIEKKKIESQKKKLEQQKAVAKTPDDRVKIAQTEAKLAQTKAQKKQAKQTRSEIIEKAKKQSQKQKPESAKAQEKAEAAKALVKEDQKQTVKQTQKEIAKMSLVPSTATKAQKEKTVKGKSELKQVHQSAKQVVSEIASAKKTGLPLTQQGKIEISDLKISQIKHQAEMGVDLAKQLLNLKTKPKPSAIERARLGALQKQLDQLLGDMKTKRKTDKDKLSKAQSLVNTTKAKGKAATPQEVKAANEAEKRIEKLVSRLVAHRASQAQILEEMAKIPGASPAIQKKLEQLKAQAGHVPSTKGATVAIPREVADSLAVAERLAKSAEQAIQSAMKSHKSMPKDLMKAFQNAKAAFDQAKKAYDSLSAAKQQIAGLHKRVVTAQTPQDMTDLAEIKQKQEEILTQFTKQQEKLKEILSVDLPEKIKDSVRGLGFYQTLLHSLKHPYLPGTTNSVDYLELFD